MEKRNVIESGRTPEMEKSASVDAFERDSVSAFTACSKCDKRKRPARKPKG